VACGPAAYGGSAVRTAVSVSAVAGTLMMFSFDGSPLAARRSPLAADRCRRSAGCEHGFGERCAKRWRHSHHQGAELRHGWPNADGHFKRGGAVRQHIVDVDNDGRMCPTSLRRHGHTADSGESECGGGHCAWSVQL
jgi:hypothetical protein